MEEITVEKVIKAISKMKKGKAAGSNGVLIEAIQLCNAEYTTPKIANDMTYGEGMPTSWSKSVVLLTVQMKGIYQLQKPENASTSNESCAKSF